MSDGTQVCVDHDDSEHLSSLLFVAAAFCKMAMDHGFAITDDLGNGMEQVSTITPSMIDALVQWSNVFDRQSA